MTLLSITNATVAIDKRTVLQGVSLSVAAGEMVAICGPNGAGKSSLLKTAAGLLKVPRGAVMLGQRDITTLSALRRGQAMAYLAQERSLSWNMPAREVAALGGVFLKGDEALLRADAALAEAGVAHLSERGIAEISGGERARVLLARAMVSDADLLLADEPTAGLDPDAALLVLDLLRARASADRAVVVTMHDLTLAAHYADRVVVVADGRIVADAPPLEALNVQRLEQVFGIRGQWVDTENGPLLATRRLHTA